MAQKGGRMADEDTPAAEPETEPTTTTEEPPAEAAEVDWKAQARRHERLAKTERKQREEIAARLKEREQADQSEQEKAVAKAREEGETKARGEAEKERRADRLETAAIRLASRGLKVGAGEDTSTLRFADPDDAFVHLERMIRRGDLDDSEIFDADGRVQTQPLTTALAELLADKPHLAAAGNGNSSTARVQGSADGGRGAGAGKALEEMSVEEHFKRLHQK
jgi:hypothetical protein